MFYNHKKGASMFSVYVNEDSWSASRNLKELLGKITVGQIFEKLVESLDSSDY